MRWAARSHPGRLRLPGHHAQQERDRARGVKKSRSLVGRAVRRCVSRARPSRPFDRKLVLCRIVLMSSNQGGALRRRWPGVSAGLCLGPARRTPGHTGCDPGSERLPASCRCSEPSSSLSIVQLAPPRLGRPCGPSHAIGYAGSGYRAHSSGIRRLRGRRGESSSLDQAAEILDRSGADYTPSDPALRGDHERAGEGADGNEPVKLSRDKVARVTQAWVQKPVLLHVGLRAGRVVRHVDTDELDARWLELPRGNRQGRCFLLADRTP